MAYRFSLDFQKHILGSLLRDESFIKESLGVVKPGHFGDEIYAGIAECALDFWRKYREAPSLQALLKEIKGREAPGRKNHEYADIIKEIYALSTENEKYYQEQALEFARAQAIQGALRSAVPLLEEGDIDGISQIIKSAANFGRAASADTPYDYFGESHSRIKSYLNGHGKAKRLGTGIPMLDEAMNGGLGRGEMGVIVALPGFGKTTTLVNFGARAVLQNKRVAYVTLELSKKMIAGKFDSNLFGMTLDKIKTAPKEFASALVEMRDRLTGSLHIMEFPTKGKTVDQIQAIMEKLEDLDLVLIDYGQLVKAPTKREQSRHELTEVYEGLRRMAGELKVPVWTAHQANRPGTNAKVIQMEHIAEDFNVAAISDICVSVNHLEEENRKGAMRLFIMKSRIGPSGLQIEMLVNWKTARITYQ